MSELTDLLASGYAHENKASLHQKWIRDNPNETNAVQYVWNHEGNVDPTRVIPVTEHGQAWYALGKAYGISLEQDAAAIFPPLGPFKITQTSFTVRKGHNGWPTVDIAVPVGTLVYAPETPTKIPHVNDGWLVADGNNSHRFAFEGCELLHALDEDHRKFPIGTAFAKVTGSFAFAAVGPGAVLFRYLFADAS